MKQKRISIEKAMKIIICFSPRQRIKFENWAEKIESSEINWTLPFLPEKGDGFDWFKYLDDQKQLSFSESQLEEITNFSWEQSYIVFRQWGKDKNGNPCLSLCIGTYEDLNDANLEILQCLENLQSVIKNT